LPGFQQEAGRFLCSARAFSRKEKTKKMRRSLEKTTFKAIFIIKNLFQQNSHSKTR